MACCKALTVLQMTFGLAQEDAPGPYIRHVLHHALPVPSFPVHEDIVIEYVNVMCIIYNLLVRL